MESPTTAAAVVASAAIPKGLRSRATTPAAPNSSNMPHRLSVVETFLSDFSFARSDDPSLRASSQIVLRFTAVEAAS